MGKHRSHKFLNGTTDSNLMSMLFKFIVAVGLVLGVVAFILVLIRKDNDCPMEFTPPGSLNGECIKVSDNLGICSKGLKCNKDNVCVHGGATDGSLNSSCVMGADNSCKKGLVCVSDSGDNKNGESGHCMFSIGPSGSSKKK